MPMRGHQLRDHLVGPLATGSRGSRSQWCQCQAPLAKAVGSSGANSATIQGNVGAFSSGPVGRCLAFAAATSLSVLAPACMPLPVGTAWEQGQLPATTTMQWRKHTVLLLQCVSARRSDSGLGLGLACSEQSAGSSGWLGWLGTLLLLLLAAAPHICLCHSNTICIHALWQTWLVDLNV